MRFTCRMVGLLSVHDEFFRGIYGITGVKMQGPMLLDCLNWLVNSVKVAWISLFRGRFLLLMVEFPRRNLIMFLTPCLVYCTVPCRTPHRMHNLMFMICVGMVVVLLM